MSKTTQANKEAKLKGKQAKIAKSKVKKQAVESAEETKTTKGTCINFGCCCTCKSYPKHFRGCAQPCRVSGKYVARKAQHPECYNCKY